MGQKEQARVIQWKGGLARSKNKVPLFLNFKGDLGFLHGKAMVRPEGVIKTRAPSTIPALITIIYILIKVSC